MSYSKRGNVSKGNYSRQDSWNEKTWEAEDRLDQQHDIMDSPVHDVMLLIQSVFGLNGIRQRVDKALDREAWRMLEPNSQIL